MPLRLANISLRDFRNLRDLEVALAPGMNVLVGHNAVGKTNTIEAIQLLTSGSSFRKPSPKELVREGCDQANISCVLEGDGRILDVCCEITPRKRSYKRNGKAARPKDISGTMLSVLFNPDDLSFVKGSASYRRDEIDAFASQANKAYYRVLHSYARGIEQRNRLLKEDVVDTSLLEAWDASIALGGATLLEARMRLFGRLAERTREAYAGIAPGEELTCSYVCSLGIDPAGMSRDEIENAFLDRLEQGRADDIRRQQTLVGPHRDDISFTLDGRDARTYGSQGQQRSIVLAWKMAEVMVSRDVTGELPLLLLDDVMSELDEVRREAVSSFVLQGIQTIVTTTNLGYFTPTLLEDAKVVSFDD